MRYFGAAKGLLRSEKVVFAVSVTPSLGRPVLLVKAIAGWEAIKVGQVRAVW